MIAAFVLALNLAVGTVATATTRLTVRMTEHYDLSFLPPPGCKWDGESFLQCKSVVVYLGGYQPPRERSYSDFGRRFRKEVTRTRRAHGKITAKRLTIGDLPAGVIRYTGVRHERVIELLIGVPEQPLGEIFDVVTDETRSGRDNNVETIYRALVKTFVVNDRDVPPD